MDHIIATATHRYTFSCRRGTAPPDAVHFGAHCQARGFLEAIAETPGAGEGLHQVHAANAHNIGIGQTALLDALAAALAKGALAVSAAPMPREDDPLQPAGAATAPSTEENYKWWSDGARPLDTAAPPVGFRAARICNPYQEDTPHFIDLRYAYDDGAPVAGAAFTLTFADGSTRSGVLDPEGCRHISVSRQNAGKVQVEYENRAALESELDQARSQLKDTLAHMVAEVADQSRVLARQLAEENRLSQGMILTGAFLSGLYDAGKDMVQGACDMMAAANSAYETVKGDIYRAIAEGGLARVRDTAGAVVAKGERALAGLQQCYETLELIMGDAPCRRMLCDFPEKYFANLHISEKAGLLGGLSLDIVLALLSGGAGAAAAGLSKSRHFTKAAALVQQISVLLKKRKIAQTVSGRTDTTVAARTRKFEHGRVKEHDSAPPGDPAAEQAKRQAARHTDIPADTAKGEPVNCVTGEVFIEQSDFALPGRLPLTWTRRYGSQDGYPGLCGPGWQTPADARLEKDEAGTVTFHDGLGNASIFKALPGPGATVTAVADGAVLSTAGATFNVRLKSGLTYRFSNAAPLDRRLAERIETPYGHFIRFVRDLGGLAAITFGDGRAIEVHSRAGRIAQMRVNGRPLVCYGYNDRGELMAVIDALGGAHRYRYDDNHRVVQHTDRAGMSFYYTYDAHGRCTRTHGDGGLYDYRFSYDRLRTVVTNGSGGIQVYEYDDCHLPLRVFDGRGRLTRFEYDAVGRPSAVVDPLGRRTDYIHDRFGNLVAVARPDGRRIVTAYDARHNPIRHTDAMGRTWRMRYNAHGRLTEHISPSGAVTRYDYSAQGDLVRVTDPLGHATGFEANAFGQITALIDPLKHINHFAYDDQGRLVRATDPLGRATRYAYDSKGRLTAVHKSSGSVIACAYDAADRIRTFTDEAGRTTTFEYTGIDCIAQRLAPDGRSVRYHYNSEEQLVGITDQKGRTCTIERDSSGRIVSETDYWGATRHHVYDDAGQLIQSTDARGRTTTYEYDELGRMIRTRYGPHHTETFRYDAAGNLVAFANPATTVRRIFDKENRLIKEVQGDQSILYAYNRAGQRIRRRSPHGNRVETRYDAAGRPIAIAINGRPVTIQRDALGRPVAETLSPHIRRRYAYDPDDRVSEQHIDFAEQTGIARRYSYDPCGNLTRLVDRRTGSERFDHDPIGRIIRHLTPEDRLRTYRYDAAGDPPAEEHRHESPHLYRTQRIGARRYTFDRTGRRVERANGAGEPVMHDWDSAGRLVRIGHRFGLGIRMAYDALGRRIAKHGLGARTRFIWDGDHLLSDQKNDYDAREFVFYPGTFVPLAAIDGDGRILYYHNNPSGMPREVTDEAGRILWSACYDALGRVDQLFDTAFDNPLRLQGAYEDETGLYYIRHRYYNPRIGQFISQDPLGLAAGENLYAFAPNVYAWVDPLGLCKKASKRITALQKFYPDNDGFLNETQPKFLMSGEKIDRYGGSDYSRFFSPNGTPKGARALPPGTADQLLRTFEVVKPFEVKSGTVSPAFGELGLGTQYKTPVRMETLLRRGIIREVK